MGKQKIRKQIQKEKRLFLHRLAGEKVIQVMRTMDASDSDISTFQLARLAKSVTAIIVTVMAFFVIHTWQIFVVGGVAAVLLYVLDYLKLTAKFQRFQFERQVHFTTFSSLIDPYLNVDEGKASLFGAFRRVMQRLPGGRTKKEMARLMIKMSRHPSDPVAFQEFADRSSGTTRASVIMDSLFEYQQSSSDSSTIRQLGNMIDENFMHDVREIRRKLRAIFDYINFFATFLFIVLAGGYLSNYFMNLSNLFNIKP